jgi:hypothetical protein
VPEILVRALWLGGGAALAVGLGALATRQRRISQPPARLEGLDLEAVIVAFTSTDCRNCRKVMRLLGALDVPVREVAHELEPALFEAAGVDAVPLVIVRRNDGSVAAQFGGVPGRRRLRRAVARAGW